MGGAARIPLNFVKYFLKGFRVEISWGVPGVEFVLRFLFLVFDGYVVGMYRIFLKVQAVIPIPNLGPLVWALRSAIGMIKIIG